MTMSTYEQRRAEILRTIDRLRAAVEALRSPFVLAVVVRMHTRVGR
jgi:hypothetical protein